jgi:hypothetical protein
MRQHRGGEAEESERAEYRLRASARCIDIHHR